MSDFNPEAKYYPSLSISSSDLPEIKDWEVGEKYCIQVEVTMTGKSQYKDNDIDGNFDIKQFCLADAEGDDLEDDDDEDDAPVRKGRSARS